MDWLKNNKILVIVLLLAALLRFYRITEIPYGFDGDEAAFGYYGYSLLTNATDEFGTKFPLYFPSIGDYKYPVYAYATIIPTALFGPGIFSARFISALSGVLLVFVLYKLILSLTGKNKLALTTALLASISPYSILFSRGAYESNLAIFFVTTAVYFLIKKDRKEIYFLIFLILSIFTYSATRLFWIMFLPSYVFIQHFFLKVKISKKLILMTILSVSIVVMAFVDPRSRVRALNIGFFDQAYSGSILQENILEDGQNFTNVKVTRFFHNKYTTFAISFLQRYISHLDFTYLFLESNPSLPKYSIINHGLIFLFEIATILYSFVFYKKYKKSHLFFLLWLVLSFVPSSLTIETPNPIRALISLPPLLYFSSVGLYEFISTKDRIAFRKIFISMGIIFLSLFYFWHQYTVHDIYHQPWHTDGGLVEAVKSASNLKDDFDKVVFTDNPYIFVLLFNKISPKEFLSSADIEKEELGKWERVNSFDKYIFKMNVNCPKIGRKGVLYVCKGDNVPLNGVLHDVIRFKDGLPAFLLVEFVPYSQRTSAVLPDRVHYMVETDLSFDEALLSEDENRYW